MKPLYDEDAFLADLAEEQLTQGVMWRRVAAWLVDGILIAMILAALWGGLLLFGIATLGFGLPLLGLLPVVPLLYHWLCLASPMSASPGQVVFGLAVRRDDDLGPPTPLQALAFTVLLYLTLALGAIWVLVALVTVRHRTFHDMLSGLLVVRARALTRASWFGNMGAGPHAPGGRTRA
jgi:uncharacterized RDD family membrane protein YckC